MKNVKKISLILVLILILGVFVGCSTNKAPDGISQEIYDEVVYIVKNIENEMEKQHYLDHKDIEKIKAYTSNYLLNEEHNLTDKEFELMQKLIHVTISTVDMKIASESKDEEKYKLHEREYKSNINEIKRIIKIK